MGKGIKTVSGTNNYSGAYSGHIGRSVIINFIKALIGKEFDACATGI
jgi:hypothetical protein